MRTFPLTVGAWLLGVAVAAAQAPPRAAVPHGDAHFVIGHQNLHKPQSTQHDQDWLHGMLYGGAGAGWYWTEHLKAQVDVGAGTEARQYRYEPTVIGGQAGESSSRVSVRQQSLAVAQHYQIFRNRWIHPHVGAGIEIARETTTDAFGLTFFNYATRDYQPVTPRIEGPRHRTIARPFAETGFKAYMTRRAFFTGDSRLMFRHGIDEVLIRFGFGVDF